jgi:hypothetical protein
VLTVIQKVKFEMYSVRAQQIPFQFSRFDNGTEVCLSATSILPMYGKNFLAVDGVCFVN